MLYIIKPVLDFKQMQKNKIQLGCEVEFTSYHFYRGFLPKKYVGTVVAIYDHHFSVKTKFFTTSLCFTSNEWKVIKNNN